MRPIMRVMSNIAASIRSASVARMSEAISGVSSHLLVPVYRCAHTGYLLDAWNGGLLHESRGVRGRPRNDRRARCRSYVVARIVELEHTFCRSDLEPLEVSARAIKIVFGHPAVRCRHQQKSLDRRPGAAGGSCDLLHHDEGISEDRPVRHAERTAVESRQSHRCLFEVLRARGGMNVAFAEFIPVLQPLYP